MAKRGPQSELTDRNWDQEEEPEEAGHFTQATQETIQQRVIKKAKRRGLPEEGTGTVKAGAFGGFGGLVSKAPQLTQIKDQPFGLKSSVNDSVFSTGGATSAADSIGASKSEGKDNSAYLHGLKSLNESVLAWIKQHVEKNPYIILSPIFKDYEKYRANLEAKKATASATNGSSSTSSPSSATTTQNNGSLSSTKSADETTSSKKEDKSDKDAAKPISFTFGSTSSSNGEGFKLSTGTSASAFSFGKNSTAATTTAAPSSGFSFSLAQTQSSSLSATSTTTAATSGFSFGGSTTTSATSAFGNSGFSFGQLAAKSAAGTGQEGASSGGADDDEYVPPKPEVKEIKEDGSIFSKKCKLFYQKEGQWTERGVGNVHVKPLEGNKTQLLVRADTNLGNILLNVGLSSGLPTSRQGKNNVLLVCVPNPPLKEGQTTPIPMLIRVKTGEEADELLSKLEERKALL